MKIALLTTDNREQHKRYDLENPYFGTAIESLLEGFAGLNSQVEIHVISCAKKKMRSPKKIATNIFFHQPIVPHLGWGRSLFLGCIIAVRKTLHKIQPDIVHGQGTERDCAISAVFSGYTNVITIHGNMRSIARAIGAKHLSYYWMMSKLEKFTLHYTNGVLCNSAYTNDEVSIINQCTWRVPNCIRSAFLRPHSLMSSREKKIIVLGTIITYKQSLEILRMWSKLYGDTADVKIIFIGPCSNGDYGNAFKELLASPSLRDRAEHIGWLDTEELIKTLDSARGMIHFPTEEAFGLAVAEGLSRNLKLFAADTGGIPDVALGCEGVELFASDNWDELADRLLTWINNGMPTPNCAHTIRNRFDPEFIANRHLDIYKKIIR